MRPLITTVVVDNGEKLLERCLQSLRQQTVPVKIIVASGPKTDVALAEKYADKVMNPVTGIGRARVQAILEASTPYVVSADSDSVPDYSPIIIKDGEGNVDCVSIEELWNLITSQVILTDKGEEVKKSDSIQVYHGNTIGSPWGKLRYILRHLYSGSLIRVNTIGGLVDVTPNHSLILSSKLGSIQNGAVINAEEAREGIVLSAPSLDIKPPRSRFFQGSEAIAWLKGFFSAEGCVSIFRDKRRDWVYDMSFSNKNRTLLDRVESIMKTDFNLEVASRSHQSETNVFYIRYRHKKLCSLFKGLFYYKSKKRVPREIINAPENIQKAFLEGYFDGDGTVSTGTSYQKFSTNSWLLAQGLLILINQYLGKSFSIETRDDKPNCLAVVVNQGSLKESSQNNNFKLRGLIRKIRRVDYNGYVYDLDVEGGRHSFNTGVGQIRVHNTVYDSKYCEYVLEDLKAWRAVRAGSIRPLEGSPLAWVETATQLAFAYEFSLAFRRQAFLDAGIHELDYSHPKNDIGREVLMRLLPLPDPRMVCWTRFPTYHAELAAPYLPIAIAGLAPLAASAGVALANEIEKIVEKRD